MIRILANENIPYPSIKLLRENSFIVESVDEIMKGAKDTEILKKAFIENLVIITFDKDYGDLIFKYKKEYQPSVVLFRIDAKTPEFAAELLIKRIEKEGINIEGYFTVIENDSTRQRKLLK